jgi:predicted HAD superfamily Cof-like phosphohydrolase
MSNKTAFQRVTDFCKAFGQEVKTEVDPEVYEKNPKLIKLRLDLIREESSELEDACKAHDMVETIDALADNEYVIEGMGVQLGIDLDQEYDKIHANDLVDLSKLVPNSDLFTKNTDLVHECIGNINDSIRDLEQACKDRNVAATTKALVDIRYVNREVASKFNIDLDRAFDLVHDSNMTKLCTSEQEAKDTVGWYEKEYAEGRTKYDSPTYREADLDGYWAVYNESSGKILKSINYTPVNLSVMLS